MCSRTICFIAIIHGPGLSGAVCMVHHLLQDHIFHNRPYSSRSCLSWPCVLRQYFSAWSFTGTFCFFSLPSFPRQSFSKGFSFRTINFSEAGPPRKINPYASSPWFDFVIRVLEFFHLNRISYGKPMLETEDRIVSRFLLALGGRRERIRINQN